VLLFVDGGDTPSWLPARALLERARRSEAVVYVVTRRAPRPDVRLEYRPGIELWTPRAPSPAEGPAMMELAGLTGGHVFVVERTDDLRATFFDIVSQFRSRYLLRYRPRGVNEGGWHPIALKLTTGARRRDGAPRLPRALDARCYWQVAAMRRTDVTCISRSTSGPVTLTRLSDVPRQVRGVPRIVQRDGRRAPLEESRLPVARLQRVGAFGVLQHDRDRSSGDNR
jgi:hypothetical protein